jgi:pimeloyl-ACP methyl ester carboxylesterase
VDSEGYAYVTGWADSADFPTAYPLQATYGGGGTNGGDAFVAKLRVDGSGLIYSTYLGGKYDDSGSDITVDSAGNAYVTGITYHNDFPIVRPLQGTSGGSDDAFVAKLNASGSALVYSTYLGGRSEDHGRGIAVDSAGNAYVTGETYSDDFPSVNPLDSTFNGYKDAFVAKLTADGSVLVYSTYLGGSQAFQGSEGIDIAVDSTGNAYVIGYTLSDDFPMMHPVQSSSGGEFDAFVAKISDGGGETPVGQTPLIFIPGIMGSRLQEEGGEEYWPGLWLSPYPLRDPIKFTKLSLAPGKGSSIIATDVIRDPIPGIGFDDVYKPLLDMLTNPDQGGYVEYRVNDNPYLRTKAGCDTNQGKPTLFVFAYDWRQSNADNARLLDDYVRCIQKLHGSTQVDILAHSMGGLVARRYILDYPGNVNKFIGIGNPWLGAPKAVHILEVGRMDISITPGLLLEQTLKALVEFYPGAHELLPSQAYFELLGTTGATPFREEGWDINERNGAFEHYSYADLIDMLQKRHQTDPGEANARFHVHPGQDDWRNDTSGVQYYLIHGIQPEARTIGSVRAVKKPICDFSICPSMPATFKFDMTRGDGTVPTLSAERRWDGHDLNYSAVVLRGFESSDINAVEHNGLTKNPDVHAYILDILRGTALQGASVAEIPPAEPAYYFEIIGTPTVTVTDMLGHVTNPLTATDNLVPDMTYYPLGDAAHLVILPSDQTYTVTFQTSADPIAIEITQGTDETTSQAVRYQDLVLPPHTTAMVRLTSQGAENLHYDGDGDGTFETAVPPTVSVSDTDANDIDPPVITMTRTGTLDNLTVTLTATDSSAGLKHMLVSLDGTTFQPYTGPIQVDTRQNPIVYAFADDNVANRSSLYTYQLVQQVYLPLLVR